jgi:hypothetical protein
MYDPNVIVAAFLVLAALAWGLYKVPHHTCPECKHCQALEHEKAVREHDKFHAYFGIKKPDPKCNRCNEGMR